MKLETKKKLKSIWPSASLGAGILTLIGATGFADYKESAVLPEASETAPVTLPVEQLEKLGTDLYAWAEGVEMRGDNIDTLQEQAELSGDLKGTIAKVRLKKELFAYTTQQNELINDLVTTPGISERDAREILTVIFYSNDGGHFGRGEREAEQAQILMPFRDECVSAMPKDSGAKNIRACMQKTYDATGIEEIRQTTAFVTLGGVLLSAFSFFAGPSVLRRSIEKQEDAEQNKAKEMRKVKKELEM